MKQYLLFALVLLIVAIPVAGYPTVIVSAPGSQHVASSPVNSEYFARTQGQYRNQNYNTNQNYGSTQGYGLGYSSATYDYVDGYEAGYSMGARDTAIYAHSYRNDDLVNRRIGNGFPFAVPRGQAAYYNSYTSYTTPGSVCDFGRRDLCLFTYAPCATGRCQVGNPDYSQYSYYNPHSVPGLYPLEDRSGIYYVN